VRIRIDFFAWMPASFAGDSHHISSQLVLRSDSLMSALPVMAAAAFRPPLVIVDQVDHFVELEVSDPALVGLCVSRCVQIACSSATIANPSTFRSALPQTSSRRLLAGSAWRSSSWIKERSGSGAAPTCSSRTVSVPGCGTCASSYEDVCVDFSAS